MIFKNLFLIKNIEIIYKLIRYKYIMQEIDNY